MFFAYFSLTLPFVAIFRSQGQAQAMFLRHEGFLGALGAFMSYEKHGLDDLMVHQLVERFPMGAPYIGGNVHGPPLGDLNEKVGLARFICCPLYDFGFYLTAFSFPIALVHISVVLYMSD